MQATMDKIQANLDALDVKTIRTIRLADGVHAVTDCQFVQFAVGEAHSPISPSKFYPSLRYTEKGQTWTTPLGAILGFSDSQSR